MKFLKHKTGSLALKKKAKQKIRKGKIVIETFTKGVQVMKENIMTY